MIDGKSAAGRPRETRDGQGTATKQQGSQKTEERQGEVGCGRRLRSWRVRQTGTAGGLPGREEVSRARRTPARFATQALKCRSRLRRAPFGAVERANAEKSSIRRPGRSMRFWVRFVLCTLPASESDSPAENPTDDFRGAAMAATRRARVRAAGDVAILLRASDADRRYEHASAARRGRHGPVTTGA